jgi:hypothetical protein
MPREALKSFRYLSIIVQTTSKAFKNTKDRPSYQGHAGDNKPKSSVPRNETSHSADITNDIWSQPMGTPDKSAILEKEKAVYFR